jgi:tetratricopeptide (TPR) repeat protein
MKPTYMILSMFAATMFSTASFAAGESSGGDEAAPKATETTVKCKKTEVYDKKLKKCVELKKSGMNEIMDEDALYDTARELAYFERPEEAIILLKQIANQNQPRVQNYLGFANRKAGRMEDAMMYYNIALSMDPNYVLARSYMGQGLLEQGDFGGAYAQLREIKERAGTHNRSYEMLASAITGLPTDY